MTALNELGAAEIVRLIREGRTSPSAVMAAHLERIAEREPDVRAFIHLDAKRAMQRARRADDLPARGALHGVPFAIKDIIDTDDMPTAWGSEIFSGRRPAQSAACVRAFLDAGAIPVGKTVTTEFAYFRPGSTRNPRNLAHTPGGSSSGSAAAVADCMVPLAFGSQTAGSLIRPASFCGICTLKPGGGRYDASGVMTLAPSLDAVGVLAREPQDIALAHAVLTGDAAPGRAARPVPRLGLLRGPHWHEGTDAMRDVCTRALQALSAAGAVTCEISHPPVFAELTEAQQTVMLYEVARARADLHDSHRHEIDARFADALETGRHVSKARYEAALAMRDRANAWLETVLDDCDALVVPAAPGEAPEGLGATGDPLFNRMWTLLQGPCMALPFGVGPLGLPLGIQLVGRRGAEDHLIGIADWAHRALLAANPVLQPGQSGRDC